MTQQLTKSIIDNDRFAIFNSERKMFLDIDQMITIGDRKRHYSLNFVDPSCIKIIYESILLISGDYEFTESSYYRKFNKENYKIVNFYNIFNNEYINISLSRSSLTINILSSFYYTINLKKCPSAKEFLAEIVDCCNYIKQYLACDFEKLEELAQLLNAPLLYFTKSSLCRAIALDEQLEYLVINPKYNDTEYIDIIKTLVLCDRKSPFSFTLNGIKFSITSRIPLSIDIPGLRNTIIIDSAKQHNIYKLAVILENQDISNKFKNNINYYILTSL